MKTVMVSGHFDPFTHAHLDYVRQAMNFGPFILCAVSSDKQLMMKKKKVNVPEEQRRLILDLVLEGLHVPHRVIVNQVDNETPLIAKLLRIWQPDILVRGGDKTPADIPEEEQRACEEAHTQVFYAAFRIDAHGSQMDLTSKEL